MLWLQKRRRIEAINGAWAMLGLTAGLVIEGQSGNGILAQVNCFGIQAICLVTVFENRFFIPKNKENNKK